MSFYSKEYIKCRNTLENVKTPDEIQEAVDLLDEKWNLDNSIMNDKDWPKLVNNITDAMERIGMKR